MTDVARILDTLEKFYGKQSPNWPTEPYEFLVWWHCGYPPSDAACAKGWTALEASVGIGKEELIGAPVAKLAAALKAGGMVPEQRAMRLKEVAARARKEKLHGDAAEVRKALKRFPNIADPGADRILLFAGIAPVAAVPSNCPQVLPRIARGRDAKSYAAQYREAQEAIEAGVAGTVEARQRAYLLLKRHGQEICKRSSPRCGACPVRSECAFARNV